MSDDRKNLCAHVRRTDCALYEIRGVDRLDFLQRLTTNDVAALAAGSGTATVLTTPKGRILDVLFLLANEDHLIALGGVAAARDVLAHVQQYTITEDVSITEVSAAWTAIALIERHSGDLANALPECADVFSLPLHHHREACIDGIMVHCMRGFFFRGPGLTCIVAADEAEALYAAFEARGVREDDKSGLERMRILNGIPGWGSEWNDRYNPLEAGCEEAVSFTKGCYIGQEVIARLHSFKKVQRALAGIEFDGAVQSPLPLTLRSGTTTVGELTSLFVDEQSGTSRGLCILRREAVVAGTKIRGESFGREIEGTVRTLPFTTV